MSSFLLGLTGRAGRTGEEDQPFVWTGILSKFVAGRGLISK